MDINGHILVSKHKKLSKKEKDELFKKYNITLKELPKIVKKDAAIVDLKAEVGDVIMIERRSPTSKIAIFYRGVISG